jgi:hypothetical protein
LPPVAVGNAVSDTPMMHDLDRYNRCRVCRTILDPGEHCEKHYRRCAWCERVLPVEYFLSGGYLCRGCRS